MLADMVGLTIATVRLTPTLLTGFGLVLGTLVVFFIFAKEILVLVATILLLVVSVQTNML